MTFGIEKCTVLIKKQQKKLNYTMRKASKHSKKKKSTNKHKKKSKRNTPEEQENDYSRNFIEGTKMVRYSGSFLNLTREEHRNMDPKKRKLMIMHKTLHLRDDMDRLYVIRKKVGRGFAKTFAREN